MDEDKDKKRPKQEGRALEIDVIKKISHQLDRDGLSVDAMGRILQFVASAVQEKKLAQLRGMDRNGQMALADEIAMKSAAERARSNGGLF